VVELGHDPQPGSASLTVGPPAEFPLVGGELPGCRARPQLGDEPRPDHLPGVELIPAQPARQLPLGDAPGRLRHGRSPGGEHSLPRGGVKAAASLADHLELTR